MNNQNEREQGTARVLFDRFKVNNGDVSRAVVDIVPGFTLGGVLGEPVPQGDIITVYRKGR